MFASYFFQGVTCGDFFHFFQGAIKGADVHLQLLCRKIYTGYFHGECRNHPHTGNTARIVFQAVDVPRPEPRSNPRLPVQEMRAQFTVPLAKNLSSLAKHHNSLLVVNSNWKFKSGNLMTKNTDRNYLY